MAEPEDDTDGEELNAAEPADAPAGGPLAPDGKLVPDEAEPTPDEAGAPVVEAPGIEPSLASSAIAPDLEPQLDAPSPEPPPPAPPPSVPPAPRQPVRRPRRGWLGRLVLLILFLTVIGPLLAVGVSRFLPVAMTPLMAIRLAQGRGWDYRWRSLDDISPALVQAAVAAEDARFCSHHGFDFDAMRKAMAHNEKRPGKVRGGSTISQQAAKNVFLWPARSYVRKGFEAYFTVLTEALWGKRRIMEVYLNVVEWGPGIYGAEAASRRYFGVDAADLTPQEAARLTAILPSPLKWKAVNPGRYVARRSRRIGAASGTVRADGLAACVYR